MMNDGCEQSKFPTGIAIGGSFELYGVHANALSFEVVVGEREIVAEFRHTAHFFLTFACDFVELASAVSASGGI